jgi:hypothetical protein
MIGNHPRYTPDDLKHLGYTPDDLKHLGYTPDDLKHLGYTPDDRQSPGAPGLVAANLLAAVRSPDKSPEPPGVLKRSYPDRPVCMSVRYLDGIRHAFTPFCAPWRILAHLAARLWDLVGPCGTEKVQRVEVRCAAPSLHVH